MPKQPRDFFRDPENPTVDEMRNLLNSPIPSPDHWIGDGIYPNPKAPMSEHTAQRLLLSMEALTMALQENTAAMTEQVEEVDEPDQYDHPPSLMHPGRTDQ